MTNATTESPLYRHGEVICCIDNVITSWYILSKSIKLKGVMNLASTNISIRTDIELKTKAQQVFADLGLDMSTAINIFLHQVVHKQAIPFKIAKTAGKTTKLGGWEGKIHMSDDFNDPMDEFNEYM